MTERMADTDPTLPDSDAKKEETSADKLWKTVFRYFLKDLVEIVRPRLAVDLDLDSLRFLPLQQFKDFRKYGHAEPDLVAETAFRDENPETVFVHVDIEAKFLKAMDKRMGRYGIHLILDSDVPVISIAVFLNGGPVGVERRRIKMTARRGWESGRYYYLAFGLSKSLAEEYVDLPQPLAPALAAVMRSEVWDRVEQKLRCLKAISRARGLDMRRRFVLVRVVNTYLELDEDENQRFSAMMKEDKEVYEMVVTWEEALAESKAEGKVEGKIEATRTAIVRLAKSMYREVPPDFEEKIRAIKDLDRLYEILEQIPQVRSVGDLDLD